MDGKYKYLFKNLGILTISNFASKILVFLLVPLYTSVLSTEEYGTYDLVVTTIQMLFPIITLNIVDAVMRFLMDRDADKGSIITIGFKYISIGLIIGIIIIIIINISPFFYAVHGLELLIYAYFFFYILNQFYIEMAKGLEKVTDMGIAGVLGTVSMVVFNVFFLLLMKWGLKGFFLANIISQAVPVFYFTIRLKPWNFIDTKQRKHDIEITMIHYSIPLIFSVLAWWINSASDKYVVTLMVSVAANGILSVSYKIPSIINTLESIFVQAWQISAIKEYGNNDTSKFYGNAFLYLNALMVLACSFLILITRPLAHILYAKEFYQAWQYVPFLLVSSVINSASGFIGPILSAKKDSKNMALSAIYGAVANVGLNILLCYLIGVQGVTIATVISSFIIYGVRKKAAKDDLSIQGYKWIVISWIFIVAQAYFESYLKLTIVETGLMIVIIAIYWRPLKQLAQKAVRR